MRWSAVPRRNGEAFRAEFPGVFRQEVAVAGAAGSGVAADDVDCSSRAACSRHSLASCLRRFFQVEPSRSAGPGGCI